MLPVTTPPQLGLWSHPAPPPRRNHHHHRCTYYIALKKGPLIVLLIGRYGNKMVLDVSKTFH